MTAEHIFFIPIIFLLGVITGGLAARKNFRTKEDTQLTDLSSTSKSHVSSKLVLYAFAFFLGIFAITHFFQFPGGAKAVQAALGHQPILDKRPSFSSAEVYHRLEGFSSEGLLAYQRFTYTADLIFPASLLIFLYTLTRLVSREKSFQWVRIVIGLPFAWFLFDLAENSIIFSLIYLLPDRNIFLGSILGYVTAGKFGLLLLSLVAITVTFFFPKGNDPRVSRKPS